MNSDLKLTDTFEIAGYWWTSAKPERKVPGILKFSSENISLELIGSLQEISDLDNPFEFDIILGISTKNENITLHKCYHKTSSMNTKRIGSIVNEHPEEQTPTISFIVSSYVVLYLFIGVHFDKPDRIKFKSIAVHYRFLDEWLGISGFHTDTHEEDTIIVRFTRPSKITNKINDECEISFGFNSSHEISSRGTRQPIITQTAFAIISNKSEQLFSVFLKHLHHLRNFLSLAIMNPTYPIIISGQSELSQTTLVNGTVYYNDISILYNLIDIPDSKKMRLKTLFTFNEISDNIEYYLKNWFEKRETLEPVLISFLQHYIIL